MNQEASGWALIALARVLFQGRQYGICGGQSGHGTCSSPGTLVCIVPVPVCPTQIPHALPWARIRTSAGTDRQLRASGVPSLCRRASDTCNTYSFINLTRYGLDTPGSNPGGGEIFRTHPDRRWGPHSLIYNGYRVFPGGKAAGAWR
jgi:hypothetical protein